MSDRFDYGQNPEKTLDGALIRSYECDPLTADSEFLLSKARYKSITGREQKRDADVLCYQIRQSFPPGELDPEEALNTFKRTPEHWDLLIVDEAMPKLRGTALLQYMKQHNHDLRVILVTGLVGDSAIRLHAERQIDEILTKPVEFEALSGTIVRLLSEETSDK